MISGSCHCGAVRFELDETPRWLTDCNCSICRRLGALWAHANESRIRIVADDAATERYVWGDASLAFIRCATCGCTTHWVGLDAKKSTRMAVNCRMAESAAIEGIRIRRLDGADSWVFLD